MVYIFDMASGRECRDTGSEGHRQTTESLPSHERAAQPQLQLATIEAVPLTAPTLCFMADLDPEGDNS